MADDEERENYTNSSRNYSRGDDIDSSRRSSGSSRDSDRRHGHRNSDRQRSDSSKHNRRRSRSRSGSRERTSSSSTSRSGRDRSRADDRRRSDDDDDYGDDYEDEEGTYGSSRRSGSYEHDEGQAQRRRDRRDDERQSSSSGTSSRITGQDWRSKLTSIRDAHFNRSKQAPVLVKNQFKNDGSFLEMFKRKMAEQAAKGEEKPSLTPNSLVLASSSIPFSPDLDLPPLTAAPIDGAPMSSASGRIDPDEDVDGVPMTTPKSLPVPVSVGKRRLAKPLKTGIVHKKPQEPEEDEASQEKLDAWSRYLQEVQKYKAANCIDEDSSRPLVK